ncbi:hypothetical protein FDA94_29215 [Herbidospora galbida]|uniref:Uncharacterized protein n=1 Tax=Herbidospora galbida TaxID=2575442 RepID=A0A4U3MAT3_9ACTN|nr:hypothetical protein [Herbidospora galbida]TKK84696.1 hypothetical protein FDA94_29215 [Herbidospora galbida]
MAAISSVLDEQIEQPVMQAPPADVVTLPCGLMVPGEAVITTAQVRELTGLAEEAIARAATSSGRGERALAALLEHGVVKLGRLEATDKLLNQLTIGDRDCLVLEIRRMTYGDTIEYERWVCPECQGEFELSVSLDDIPVVTSDEPGKNTLTVPLRKGRTATVRMATGADQDAISQTKAKTGAEIDTELLMRTVMSVTDVNGNEHSTVGNRQAVREQMSMADRASILKAIRKQRPGPRLDEVKVTCPDCGESKEITVTLDALFQS